MSNFKNIAIAALASLAAADIVEVGLWTGHDWYDNEHNVGVAHGIPYSNDAATLRMLNGPKPLNGDVPDYLSKANVQRVKNIMDEASYQHLFPFADDVYSYDGFLHAVGKFPTFCAENNRDMSDETACKRELATMFAHFVKETSYNSPWEESANGIDMFRQGLYYIEQIGCEGGNLNNPGCDYHGSGWVDAAWPNQPNKQYYGRGPFQLSYTFNYGQFSNIFKSNDYNSKLHLLKNPEEVGEDGYTAFGSAFWYYMTPQSPKPSMHDIVTGYFIPNDVDEAAGIKGGFGSTTNAINGGVECGWGASAAAQKRADYYEEFLNYFDINETEDDLLCADEKAFPAGGAGTIPSYFEYNWRAGHSMECSIVTWQTPYSLFAVDDYKRCVCDLWGAGEVNCPQA